MSNGPAATGPSNVLRVKEVHRLSMNQGMVRCVTRTWSWHCVSVESYARFALGGWQGHTHDKK